MAADQFSLASVVEDVLQQHNIIRWSDVGSASKRTDEASLRRYEAARWLRKTVGVVAGKDLPAEPSEEEFRQGLRSGIILCYVVNKIQPGAVPKVVEAPTDSVLIPDGPALSAFQYFENVMNFLAAVEELGLPVFEASDLEKGGKSARIVNCVLALKSYAEWKQNGNGPWRYGTNSKPHSFGTGKRFVRKNAEPFRNSIARTCSAGERSIDSSCSEHSLNSDLSQDIYEAGTARSINALVRAVLSDRKEEEIPYIVESVLNKVTEEFERRLGTQNEMLKLSQKIEAPSRAASGDGKDEEGKIEESLESNKIQEFRGQDSFNDNELRTFLKQHQKLVEKQRRDIEALKQTVDATKAGIQLMQMKCQEEFDFLGMHLHGLAYAATGYKRVLEENRKLYNQVQDLKGNIRVYCRVRPFLPGQQNALGTVDNIEEGTIKIITPSKHGKEGRKSFIFNKVFDPSATQEEVFSDTQPLIRSVLDGYKVCIFAYGQTGSGKTYTMTGPDKLNDESLGVNYRALTDLFHLSNQRKDTISYNISVQMLEIYNEQVRDLLATDGQNKRLEVRNSSSNGINVPDAKLVPVSSTNDVINLMNLGQKNRAVGTTAMNDRSSRSHSCLTVHVQGRDLTSGSILRGSMHLVDLAGSERVDKSEATGDRLKEAQYINKSLSALGDVISSLAQKNPHVPYRNSKLTQLLQDSLGGQAKTLMFVHISPELEALGETISTLKFAERVSTVELGAARVNKDSSEVKELKEQIVSLKAALAKKEAETENSQHYNLRASNNFRRKSLCLSSSYSKVPNVGEFSSILRGQVEDSSATEAQSDSVSSRRQSLDIQDLVSSPSCTSPSVDGIEDDRDSGSGDWVDKAVVNKQELGNNKEPFQENLLQKCVREPSKIYPEQCLTRMNSNGRDNGRNSQDFEVRRIRCDVASMDGSDEAATSDCSETELMWQLNEQLNASKLFNINPSGMTTKSKKNLPGTSRTAETRSSIPSLIPPPTRKLPSGVNSHVQRPGKTYLPGKKKIGIPK